jgi:hypothetical protein
LCFTFIRLLISWLKFFSSISSSWESLFTATDPLRSSP